jgi:hypothetical protein
MKNILVLLVSIFILWAGTISAQALLLQGPNGFYSPILPIFSQHTAVLPQNPTAVVEDPTSVGATILIESYPVALLNK